MRVLYLNPFSQEISGPDESLLTLLSCLIPLGIEAHVGIPTDGPHTIRYRSLGATVHVLPMTILRRSASIAELRRLLRSAVRSLPAMLRLCRRIRPDIIHTNMEVAVDGLVAAKVLGIPHILHYRGNTLDEPKIVFDGLVWLWTTLSRRVVCISQATAALFYARATSDKIEVIYNPVDLESFVAARRDEGVRDQLGANSSAILVGTVARLHPRKDLATFLRAAALLAGQSGELRFVIVGSAANTEENIYFDQMRALALELGLRDKLIWAGARRDIPAVMKALDIFVLTSRHEGFGRVVAEAMAAGCPVVVSDEGGLPELVDGDRFGLSAAAGDPVRFAAQIGTLLSEPTLRGRYALAGRERSAIFDVNTVAARVFEIYRKLSGLPFHSSPNW